MRNSRVKTAFVCLTAFTVLLTACSANKATPEESTSGTAVESKAPATTPVAAAEPLGKYEPGITIKIAKAVSSKLLYPQGDDNNNNIWLREYEKTLGIKVTFDWTAEPGTTGYEQKMNVAIASANLPDLFKVTPQQFRQLADAGQLADLTDVFANYSTPLNKEMMNSDGGVGLAAATVGGKLLGIPEIGASLYQPKLLWVRTDWLKKLNLPEPKTMQDVYAISDAFTNKDPDGNNKKDTIGLGLSKDLYNGGIALLTGFANAFHAYPTVWVKDADGKAVYGSTQPQMKAALANLQEMYKSGQIDTEFGVKDGGKISESVAANKLGMLFGENWMPYSPLLDGKKQNPAMEWKPIAIPSIDNEIAKAGASNPTTAYYVVRKGYEHPEAVIKMLNLAQELTHKTPIDPLSPYNAVIEGDKRIETYKYAVINGGLGDKVIVDSVKTLEDALQKDDSSLVTNMLAESDKFAAVKAFQKDGKVDNWPQAMQFEAFKILSANYTGDNIVTDLLTSPTKTMGDKWTALYEKLEKETFTKIIMGAAPIDEFDNFVATWKKQGGDEITKELNDMLGNK
jgi:putative aldouronate transport system substrate-binding protein